MGIALPAVIVAGGHAMSKSSGWDKTQPLDRVPERDRRRTVRRGADRRREQVPVDRDARKAQRRMLKRRLEDLAVLEELDAEV
jgi:hypothetical protein